MYLLKRIGLRKHPTILGHTPGTTSKEEFKGWLHKGGYKWKRRNHN
jgi:hypothetical protein